jgi:hypothetical protein
MKTAFENPWQMRVRNMDFPDRDAEAVHHIG